MAAEIKKKSFAMHPMLYCHKSANNIWLSQKKKKEKSALSKCTGTVLNSTLNAEYYLNK